MISVVGSTSAISKDAGKIISSHRTLKLICALILVCFQTPKFAILKKKIIINIYILNFQVKNRLRAAGKVATVVFPALMSSRAISAPILARKRYSYIIFKKGKLSFC